MPYGLFLGLMAEKVMFSVTVRTDEAGIELNRTEET
ncbi:hypothetical protein Turpa_2382 [Turneriella parva DSM 21527]|uniref:Uncharacterized protein n=1 Tax=Turneriella parva (strain ATCC BAA-1111 / DSM 21527 / NCTC 11395 / H) TaxID=869212 RepID=I4B6W7_TURPD|nr:hypothetical protein Turpa_2382 [Turneriella parva DSM 21527]